jgi:hypothetical protein|tara:strand:- start:273 stop:431 length:159 start_codon:yes stop_codon:yes gene_type:complete
MEELITTIGELSKDDLKWFMYKNRIKNVDTFLTFLYNLNENDVKEIINELNK